MAPQKFRLWQGKATVKNVVGIQRIQLSSQPLHSRIPAPHIMFQKNETREVSSLLDVISLGGQLHIVTYCTLSIVVDFGRVNFACDLLTKQMCGHCSRLNAG